MNQQDELLVNSFHLQRKQLTTSPTKLPKKKKRRKGRKIGESKKSTKPRTPKEDYEQEMLVIWLKQNHQLMWSCDASGLRLSMGQIMKSRRLGIVNRSWPDCFIAEPSRGKHGLFIEMKRQDTKLKKVRDRTWVTPHVAEQAKTLRDLRSRGYSACFALGHKHAIKIITGYLKK